MTTRGKWAAASAALGVGVAWAIGQLLLERHAMNVMHAHEVQWRARMLLLHPGEPVMKVQPVHTRWWLLPSAESLTALMACAVATAVIAVGGRRLWALLPAAFPLTLILGASDGNSIGFGWMQPSPHWIAWLRVGAAVDAAVLVALALLLGMALSRRRATTALAPAVLRTLPIAVVAFGYWYVGHPFPDDHDRLFITRTLLLVLAAAVISTLQMPIAFRALTLFVLPFADPNMVDGLIGGYTTWLTYLQHVGVAVATMAYVVGAPYAVAKARRLRPATVTP